MNPNGHLGLENDAVEQGLWRVGRRGWGMNYLNMRKSEGFVATVFVGKFIKRS